MHMVDQRVFGIVILALLVPRPNRRCAKATALTLRARLALKTFTSRILMRTGDRGARPTSRA
jgi:hypothetical protein